MKTVRGINIALKIVELNVFLGLGERTLNNYYIGIKVLFSLYYKILKKVVTLLFG